MRLTATLALALATGALADYGIIDLDNTTFDRVVGQGLPTLVRVDKEYPYGDADDAWKEAATAVGQSDAKVLIANIGVADPPSPYRGEEYRGEYGGGPEDEDFDENAWRENQDLAERFSVSLEAFPKYFFFPADWKDGSAPVPFEGEESKDNFLRFVQEKAGVWVGMPGQVKELHVLAKGFAAASDAEKQAALKTAEASKDEAGKYYAKVMTKVMASADFVAKETSRLTKMMDDGSVAVGKKEQFRKRLNALSSFGE